MRPEWLNSGVNDSLSFEVVVDNIVVSYSEFQAEVACISIDCDYSQNNATELFSCTWLESLFIQVAWWRATYVDSSDYYLDRRLSADR